MHNPFLAWPVSAGWDAVHQAVDYELPYGTAFTSPCEGIYRHRPSQLSWTPGAAGIFGDIERSDGSLIRVCHLSAHIAGDGDYVNEETIIAASGNSGYVLPRPSKSDPHAGSHMHTTGFHANGARWNWTVGVGPYVPPFIPPTNGEIDMPWIAVVNGIYFLVVPQGNAKPKAVNLDNTGYRVPPGVNDSSFEKLPLINFQEKFSIDAFWRAVDPA